MIYVIAGMGFFLCFINFTVTAIFICAPVKNIPDCPFCPLPAELYPAIGLRSSVQNRLAQFPGFFPFLIFRLFQTIFCFLRPVPIRFCCMSRPACNVFFFPVRLICGAFRITRAFFLLTVFQPEYCFSRSVSFQLFRLPHLACRCTKRQITCIPS